MSLEAIGLIERAAVLLRQRGMSRDETYAGSGRPGQRSEFAARVQPMRSRVVESEDLNPIGILRTIARRKFMLIGSTLLFLGAAAAVIFTITPLYIAETLVLVGNRDPGVTRIELNV